MYIPGQEDATEWISCLKSSIPSALMPAVPAVLYPE
jgi:hypothetical protein